MDGIWGGKTNAALSSFIRSERIKPKHALFNLTEMVDVTSSFYTTKKKVVKSGKITNNNSGLTSIVSGPTVATTQALAICGPQAKMARNNAKMARQNRSDAANANLRCTTIGITTNCRQRSSGPSNLGQLLVYGFLKRNALNTYNNAAYNQVMDSCLASYGWRD